MPQTNVRVLIARSAEQHATAEALLNTCFGRRGYGSRHSIPANAAATFIAFEGERPVGTMSLIAQPPLATMTRLAVDQAESGLAVLRALFDAAAAWRREHPGFDRLSIEVHPRHRRFYERLGFRASGEAFNREVGAPGVLMSIAPEAAGWRHP